MRKFKRPSITSRSRRPYYPQVNLRVWTITSDSVTRKRCFRSNVVIHITAELERVTIWLTSVRESYPIRDALRCAPVPILCSKAADDGSISLVGKLVERCCELVLLWVGGIGEGKGLWDIPVDKRGVVEVGVLSLGRYEVIVFVCVVYVFVE